MAKGGGSAWWERDLIRPSGTFSTQGGVEKGLDFAGGLNPVPSPALLLEKVAQRAG